MLRVPLHPWRTRGVEEAGLQHAARGMLIGGFQELPPFSYVEINGLKIPSPQHAYTVLWEAISGARGVSTKTALRGLEGHFNRKTTGVRGPRGHTL